MTTQANAADHHTQSSGAEESGLKALGRDRTQPLTAIALGLIILLGAFLRFYGLGADSIGNAYYAAPVAF